MHGFFNMRSLGKVFQLFNTAISMLVYEHTCNVIYLEDICSLPTHDTVALLWHVLLCVTRCWLILASRATLRSGLRAIRGPEKHSLLQVFAIHCCSPARLMKQGWNQIWNASKQRSVIQSKQDQVATCTCNEYIWWTCYHAAYFTNPTQKTTYLADVWPRAHYLCLSHLTVFKIQGEMCEKTPTQPQQWSESCVSSSL